MELSDGRKLAWREFGDPAGTPCIYTTGITASSAAGWIHHSAAVRARVRWISVDKPGYGRSDSAPRRRYLDWADDIAQLADHLGLPRFAAAGESGGAAHVLAVARSLPDRVSVALVIAGLGIWHERWMRVHLQRDKYDVYDTARRNPAKSRRTFRALKKTLDDPKLREEWIAGVLAGANNADRKLFEEFPDILPTAIKAYREALDSGPSASVHELQLCTRPWGFRLGSVRSPVRLWHGTGDENVPHPVARDMVSRLPNCSARFIEGEGHGLYRCLAEIMQAVRV